MANRNQQPEETVELQRPERGVPLYSLDELRKERKLSTGVFCGVCAQEGWRPGKSVTESEFDTAVNRFLKGGGVNASGR